MRDFVPVAPVNYSDLVLVTRSNLGAASIAAIGVSTYLTIKYERGERAKRLNVGLSARGVQVGGTF